MREIVFKFELFSLTFRLSAELHGEAVVVGAPLSEPDDVKNQIRKKIVLLAFAVGRCLNLLQCETRATAKKCFLVFGSLAHKNIGDKTEGSGS